MATRKKQYGISEVRRTKTGGWASPYGRHYKTEPVFVNGDKTYEQLSEQSYRIIKLAQENKERLLAKGIAAGDKGVLDEDRKEYEKYWRMEDKARQTINALARKDRKDNSERVGTIVERENRKYRKFVRNSSDQKVNTHYRNQITPTRSAGARARTSSQAQSVS